MSELLTHYTPDNFPYSEILAELTPQIADEGMAPTEAYMTFTQQRDERGLCPSFDYVSSPITTGGHALVPGRPMAGIIAANTHTARQMTSLLDMQGSLVGSEVVLPVDLGKTGWNQSDFMTYWGLTISGPNLSELSSDVQGINGFEAQLARNLYEQGVDTDVMNDPTLDREERRVHYERFVRGYAATMADTNVTSLPAHRLISLVDPDISLGCWTEKRLADTLRIPSQSVVPVRVAAMPEAMPLPTLGEDQRIRMALGGTVCAAAKGGTLLLAKSVLPSPLPAESA